jgi:hypothetical protein
MVGRASLIMVIGFAIIFGIINLNITKLTNRSMGNMIGYNESSISRVVASAGAHTGMALFTSRANLRNTIANKDYTTGPFKGCGYTVTLLNKPGSAGFPPYLQLMSISRCTTFVKEKKAGVLVPYILHDTVIVRMDTTTTRSFSSLAWMTIVEGNVFFIDGDTLWGQVHSNGNIHIDSDNKGHHPCFMGRVTTSGKVDPTKNYADFRVGGKAEENVPERPFPPNINDAINNSTNATSPYNTKANEIWVELKPGTSADNDGYALIRTGSFSGTLRDSMRLSDATNKVIYSTSTVHIKGTLDGRLSVASGTNVKIEGNTVYEHQPDPTTQIAGSTVNSTKDMLGLISEVDVQISDDFHGNININAAIFARTGSFEAESYNTRAAEGRINLIGSIAQATRGAVGTFNSGTHTIKTGYLKNYRYDNRMWPQGDGFAGDADPDVIPSQMPPSFPGWTTTGPLAIRSWWESNRQAFIVDDFY